MVVVCGAQSDRFAADETAEVQLLRLESELSAASS